jgi:hypothetical protein
LRRRTPPGKMRRSARACITHRGRLEGPMPIDIDPREIAANETREQSARDSRLNGWVAVSIACLATFLAVCKVKDENIVQGMQAAQAEKIDYWMWYQARNIREDVATATAAQLKVTLATLAEGSPARATCEEQITSFEKMAKEQDAKKAALKKTAEGHVAAYDKLNYRDDQFDLAEALLSLAVAMLAVTALTHKRWLFFVAMVPTGFGVLMGLAGLIGWKMHPDFLIKLLS